MTFCGVLEQCWGRDLAEGVAEGVVVVVGRGGPWRGVAGRGGAVVP